MNKKEIELLDKTIKAVAMISDRLDVVFKAVEVLQEHIIKDNPNPRDYIDESDFSSRKEEMEDDIHF